MNTHITCCFTGHRKIKATTYLKLGIQLDEIVEELIAQGTTHFMVGGALGFDLLATSTIIGAKMIHPHVRLTVVLPCADWDLRWSEDDRQQYRELLGYADDTIVLAERYYDGCMAVRNRYMVEHSGVCVAFVTHERSGSAQTLRFARERGLKIINLAEKVKNGGIKDNHDKS